MCLSLRGRRCLLLRFLAVSWLLPALLWVQMAHAEAPTYADLDGYKLNEVTLTGSHNTYDEKIEELNHEFGTPGWEYYYDALEYVHVIELDFFNIGNQFNVAHDSPVSSNNNCPKHGWPGSTRNQDLDSCIQSLRYWHDLNPNHPLVIVKLEPKLGFDTSPGVNGAAQLDYVIAHAREFRTGRLDPSGYEIEEPRLPPELIFKPRDLLCKNRPTCSQGYYSTLQEAIEHNNWPTMAELRGKFLFTVVPGTANASGPRKYADQLENQAPWLTPPCNNSSCTDTWLAFPAVFALNNQDPIDWYLDGNACGPIDCGLEGGYRRLRPWFVVIDFQSGRVFNEEVPPALLDSFAAQRYLMFATYEHPDQHLVFGTTVPEEQARAQLNVLVRLSNANIVDTDVEKSGIPFAKARGRLDQPEIGPLYDVAGSGLILKDRVSGQCLGADDFGSHTPLGLPCPANGSRANSGYRGMIPDEVPAYDVARATDFMRFSVAYNARGEMRIGGLCLTASPGSLDGGAVTLGDCDLLIETSNVPPDPPAAQRWRLDTTTGKVHSLVDEGFCLARLAPLSPSASTIGTRPCGAVAEFWHFGTRGPNDPPIGDQMVRIVNPPDPYKQPPTPETCLTTDFTVPFGKLWFQPCAQPAPASQLWNFNDITGVLSQRDPTTGSDRCLELSRVSDYAFFHDDHFVLNTPSAALAAQDPTQSLSWQDGRAFPSYYPRKGTSVGHRVYLADCNLNHPQQRFGWSADERRLIGVDGHVLFHDFWGGLRHRFGGTNKPQPSDPPLLEDNGDARPLASAMNERLAGELIDLVEYVPPPVAVCRDVTRAVDNQCVAAVTPGDIDGGSYSPAGQGFFLTLQPPGPFGLGQSSVQLWATSVADAALATSCQAVVTAVDQTPPSLALNGSSPVSLQCAVDSYGEAGAVAVDNCSVNMPVSIGGSVNTAQLGIYQITYNASDAAGNAAAPLQRTVNVVDTFAPVLTLVGSPEVTLQCGVDAYAESGASAADACTPNAPVMIGGGVNTAQAGSYQVTYNASDGAGNAAAPLQRTVNVIDTFAPVLTLLGSPEMTLQCGVDPYAEPGASVADACTPNAPVTIGGGLNTAQPGSYQVTYNASDAVGNAAAPLQRSVTVIDTIAPVLMLVGSAEMTLQCGVDTYVEPGASVLDACTPNAPVSVGGDAVDTTQLGSYVVTYNVSDLSNNAAAPLQRSISVIDTLPPLLTCPANVTAAGNSCGGAVVTYPDATVTEACTVAPALTYSQASGTFFNFGTTTITVSTVDEANNQASCSFGVKVLTLQEQVQLIIDQVNQIANEGQLNHGQANSLVKKLEGVTDALNKENTTPGCNKLQAFMNEVAALKTLTAAQKESLTEAAAALQANMGCGGGNSCDNILSSVIDASESTTVADDITANIAPQSNIFLPLVQP